MLSTQSLLEKLPIQKHIHYFKRDTRFSFGLYEVLPPWFTQGESIGAASSGCFTTCLQIMSAIQAMPRFFPAAVPLYALLIFFNKNYGNRIQRYHNALLIKKEA